MTLETILPTNATDYLLTLEQALDITTPTAAAVAYMHGWKYHRPIAADLAPFLIHEYGLGPISAYFTDVNALIDQGREWQEIRGTPQAVIDALGWIGYSSPAVLDQVLGRLRWHLYQINMGALPLPNEPKLLADAEYLADVSDRARSEFWRGFYGYDVRGLTWGRSKWGRSIWGDSSGVVLPPGKVKWSHGRQWQVSITASGGDETALGVNYHNGDPLTWLPTLTWSTPGIGWSGVTDAVALKAWLMARKVAHIGFYDSTGTIIAYAPVFMAPTRIGTTPATVRYQIRTGFGVGFGSTVASVSMVFGGVPAAGVKPGTKWLLPSQITFPSGQIKVGTAALALKFQQTFREFVNVDLVLP